MPVPKYFFLLLLLTTTSMALSQNAGDTLKVFSIRATFYSDIFEGRHTASGEIFRQEKFTAAHRSLPFGTLVLVTNPKSGSQVIVRINDRCPRSGILDLTKRAAKSIGVRHHMVEAQVLPKRYEGVWAKQHELSDAMKNGTLLLEVGDSATKAHQPTTRDETLFGLHLITVKTHAEAERQLRKLPLKYQEITNVIPTATGQQKVTLDLKMSQQEALRVKKELNAVFPNSKLQKNAQK
ncbi:MAG: septal ring lytic transglycosylase RlpA family protein [Bacteroidales bacterium]|nr:septal ring lytic transglycosylase RlpA family protein [Bacteroidales bacterium]